MTVRIEKLDIVVAVEGVGEEAFAQLFGRYMQQWTQQTELAARLRVDAENERSIFGDGRGR